MADDLKELEKRIAITEKNDVQVFTNLGQIFDVQKEIKQGLDSMNKKLDEQTNAIYKKIENEVSISRDMWVKNAVYMTDVDWLKRFFWLLAAGVISALTAAVFSLILK